MFMDKIYFRYNFKLYIGHFTLNKPDQCSLWVQTLQTGEIMYLGYYDGKVVEIDEGIYKISWEIYQCAERLARLVTQPFYKRSIPGVKQLFA
jgi:hypothetical protein